MEEKTIKNGSDRKYIYRQYKTLCEAAGVSNNCFQQRVRSGGWEPYEAATTPPYGKRKTVKEAPFHSKMTENIEEKQTGDDVKPDSTYPAREYVKWRRHALEYYRNMNLGQTLADSAFADGSINDKLSELEAEIIEIEENEPYWYAVIDQYVADPKEAEKRYSRKIIDKVRQTLNDAEHDKESLIYKIYHRFTALVGIKVSESPVI